MRAASHMHDPVGDGSAELPQMPAIRVQQRLVDTDRLADHKGQSGAARQSSRNVGLVQLGSSVRHEIANNGRFDKPGFGAETGRPLLADQTQQCRAPSLDSPGKLFVFGCRENRAGHRTVQQMPLFVICDVLHEAAMALGQAERPNEHQ